MVLYHLEVPKLKIFRDCAPGPPKNITNLMVLEHLEVTNSKFFRGYAPWIRKEIAKFMVLDHLEIANSNFFSGLRPWTSQRHSWEFSEAAPLAPPRKLLSSWF